MSLDVLIQNLTQGGGSFVLFLSFRIRRNAPKTALFLLKQFYYYLVLTSGFIQFILYRYTIY